MNKKQRYRIHKSPPANEIWLFVWFRRGGEKICELLTGFFSLERQGQRNRRSAIISSIIGC